MTLLIKRLTRRCNRVGESSEQGNRLARIFALEKALNKATYTVVSDRLDVEKVVNKLWTRQWDTINIATEKLNG